MAKAPKTQAQLEADEWNKEHNVHIRSFAHADPANGERIARIVYTLCSSKTHIPFTARELSERFGVSLGLAQRICDRAVEWKWANVNTGDGVTSYYGRI